ncbi:MAG: anthrone oxygenase family protein, partial [Nostoc sp.]
MITQQHYYLALKLFSALGCGLIAGVFFAFSTFVMNALGRLQPAQGITAMQSINITVINPLFMAVFLGTAAACILLAISSLLRWHQPGAVYLLLGSLLYLVGTFGVTIVF